MRDLNTNGSNPIVSVLITAYNREKYIAEAIESVLNSTYSNFELIIVDDCSADNTVSIVKQYAQRDERIKVYENPQNLGDYPNRNKAASYAQGKYIKYLDADDLIYEHGLEVMVRYMERFKEAALGISLYKIELEAPYPLFFKCRDVIRNEYLSSGILGLGPSAAIIRTSAFRAVGGFSGEQYIGDTDLWLRLATRFPVVLFNPSLNWYRKHDDQQIFSERKNYQIRLKRLDLKKKHLVENKSHFSDEEYRYAFNRINQHFARFILSELLKTRNVSRFLYLYRYSNIGFKGLLSGLRKYQ
jgi:glycosyltransferase involved in cell wall biosynthesis